MRTVVPKAFGRALLIGVGFVSAVFCQTVEFGITSGSNNNNTNILGGIYTDPYQGNVGATPTNSTGTAVQPGTGTAVAAFCDDFTNDVNPPQFWTADQTNLNAFTGTGYVSTVYFGANGNAVGSPISAAQQTQDYVEVAYLAMESLDAGAGIGPAFSSLTAQQQLTVQEQISFALWDIFDPAVLTSDCPSSYGCLDSDGTTTNLTAATNWVTKAVAAAGNLTGAQFEANNNVTVEIYSAVGSNGSVDTDSSRPQEFVTVSTPEPSMVAFLGFDVVGVGIIGLYFRRRQSGSRS